MPRLPIHEIRHGMIAVRIRQHSRNSTGRFTVSVVRIYRNGDVYQESTRFGRDDIPLVRLLLDEAHLWILQKS